MSKKYRYIVLNEEGSSLVSTLILLVFLTVIITSVTGTVKHQILQYKQTAYSYETKALIEMAEVVLKESENPAERYPSKIEFSTGKVIISNPAPARFQLEAVLHNHYTSRKWVSYATGQMQSEEYSHEEENVVDSLSHEEERTGSVNDRAND